MLLPKELSIFKKKLFICFLAVLGLCSCAFFFLFVCFLFFLVAASRGCYTPAAVSGFLIAMASLVLEHRL